MDHLWTAMFCTIHLCLGYFLGRRGIAGTWQHVAAATVMPMVNRFDAAYSAAEPELSQLPSQLQAAMVEIKGAVQSLSQQIRPAAEKENQKSLKPVDPIPDSSPNDPGKEPDSERRGHTVPEFMAEYEGALSSVRYFEAVNCHDLSTSGISFFLERRLESGDKILITLGRQERGVIMAAKVVHSRSVIMRGDDCYRIGCQFERRLNADEVQRLRPLMCEPVCSANPHPCRRA